MTIEIFTDGACSGNPKKPVKNVDLWKQMDALASGNKIEWCWVRGHAGHVENERADALARRGIEMARAGVSIPAKVLI
ncbi:MAG: hypothetical protein IPJ25_03095 [Rhodocyclaceae bacterium]|nr:hypothetical protein [Rhodocyclaceae bacterium]